MPAVHGAAAALRELIVKEVRLLARRPALALMPLAFSAVAGLGVAVVASSVEAALAGLIATQLFLSYYAVLQGIVREGVEGALDGLRLSPVDPLIPLTAKAAAAAAIIASGSSLYVATLAFFSSPPPASPLGMTLWALAVAPGLAGVSGLTASLLAYSSEPGVLAAHINAALTAPLYLATAEPGLRAAAGDIGSAASTALASAAAAILSSAFARTALE